MIGITSQTAESTMHPIYSLEGLKLDVIPKKRIPPERQVGGWCFSGPT